MKTNLRNLAKSWFNRKTLFFMKNFILIMLISTLNMYASNSYSQQAKLSMELNGSTLKEVLREIRKQTEFTVLYRSSDVRDVADIDADFEDATVMEILDQCLEGTSLGYEVKDKVIVIHPVEYQSEPVVEEEQEKKTITGKVTDIDGIPLPGVSVVIKGTNTGVATDIDGNYLLEIEGNNVNLVFSFVGMLSQEITYTGQVIQNVSLLPDTEQVDEVVITGYQTIAKERATGSFKIVKADDLDNVASIDLADRLQGVAPGVSVNKFGGIVIRGVGTLRGSTAPLIVVNGLPYQGSINNINVEDIENITVLKDAASTSIYGVRGANGVIVITTKLGETDGKLRVNLASSFQVSQKPQINDLDLMNSAQQVELEWDVYDAVGTNNFAWYNFKSPVGELYNQWNNTSDPEEKSALENQRDQLANYNNTKELEDEFYRKPMLQKHTISFDYGTNKNRFYASVSYDEDKQFLKGSKTDNFSINLNDEFRFNDLLKLQLSVFGKHYEAKSNGYNPVGMMPYQRLREDNGDLAHVPRGMWDAATIEQKIAMGNGAVLDMFYNPIQERELTNRTTETNSLLTNASIELTPTDWMKLTAALSYNTSNTRTETLSDKNSYYVRELVNNFVEYPSLERKIPYGNVLRYNTSDSENLTTRVQLNINKKIEDFSFGLNAGLERSEFFSLVDVNNYRFNYDSQSLTEVQVNMRELAEGVSSLYRGYDYYGWFYPGYSSFYNDQLPRVGSTKDRYQSSYIIANASYKDKYDLSFSWRLDETNLFGQSDEYTDKPSWSVGAKWHFSKEDFFKLDFVNSASLKVTYGLSGNIDKSTSPFMITEQLTNYFTGQPYLRITNPANPLLGWEQTKTLNIGLDFALFNHRLNGTVEYYRKYASDVLAPVQIETTTGFGDWQSNVVMNNGEILNRGFDVGLNAAIVKRKDINYNVGLNFTYNHNEVKALDIEASVLSDAIYNLSQVVGQPTDFIFGFRGAPLDQNGEAQVYNENGQIVPWTEISNFEIEDGVFFGRKSPPYFGSMTHQFRYKKFTADLFFLYEMGHYVQEYSSSVIEQQATTGRVHERYHERWRKPGDELNTRVPALNSSPYPGTYENQAVWQSDYSINKADVVRLKSINFGYDLSSLVKNTGIKKLTIKAGIENVWHWSATKTDKIYDSVGSFPEYKNFTFGLNLQL